MPERLRRSDVALLALESARTPMHVATLDTFDPPDGGFDYERLVELCRDVFGLTISQGGVENALRRLVDRARPTYAAIGQTVRGSPVINSDETSARVAGRTCWQWTFQTPEASYHLIAASRGGEVIDAFLDGAEPVVWARTCTRRRS